MLKNTLFFALVGYLLGSILFAPIFGKLCKGKNILEESRDKNPGTANAFMYGGFLCGVLTLCGDLFKGFLPVFLYMRQPAGFDEAGLALVLAAPVVGHIFPLFSNFKGGKGIATWLPAGTCAGAGTGAYFGGHIYIFLGCAKGEPTLLPHHFHLHSVDGFDDSVLPH